MSGVQGYSFYTNFALADHQTVDTLLGLNKLRSLSVSIYGHDEESFLALLSEEDGDDEETIG